ncbi:MAG: histidine kinase [Bacteroidetes bacterium]|jgi:two-component system LytT family sensor kinase|nr:histidine kinase [Bacteroidota bacterium]MBU1577975.1 histidine kinase [Bacteroidota bacterium]MBU2465421.1 histidine kinase [Bacteroidota bacterium]MDA3942243.1 histidine kinase [Bacteroidota bacterium]
MLNPFIKNRSYLILYMAVWVMLMLIQTAILNYYQDLKLSASINDAVVFNGILAVIGFNIWYVLKFNLKDQKNTFDLIVNHLLAAIITISLWLAAGYYLLKALESGNESYLSFLNQSLPWRAIIGSFFYLIFILIYYIMLYYEDLQQKMRVETELNSLVREAELHALKSQINPHFLFNSLNSISSLTVSSPEKAQEMVIKLSDFLRYSLSHDRNETTSMKRELENIERYLDIEKVRFGHRLNYRKAVPDECLQSDIPNMILQPLFENAIKHGVYNSTEEVLIELRCAPSAEFLELHILNDFDPESTRTKGEGIGLKNIRNRLQLLYQRSDLLEIHREKIVFEVILRIPRNKK